MLGSTTGIIVVSFLLLSVVLGIILYISYCSWRLATAEEKEKHKLNKLFSALCRKKSPSVSNPVHVTVNTSLAIPSEEVSIDLRNINSRTELIPTKDCLTAVEEHVLHGERRGSDTTSHSGYGTMPSGELNAQGGTVYKAVSQQEQNTCKGATHEVVLILDQNSGDDDASDAVLRVNQNTGVDGADGVVTIGKQNTGVEAMRLTEPNTSKRLQPNR